VYEHVVCLCGPSFRPTLTKSLRNLRNDVISKHVSTRAHTCTPRASPASPLQALLVFPTQSLTSLFWSSHVEHRPEDFLQASYSCFLGFRFCVEPFTGFWAVRRKHLNSLTWRLGGKCICCQSHVLSFLRFPDTEFAPIARSSESFRVCLYLDFASESATCP
jgi:hypothetical protein